MSVLVTNSMLSKFTIVYKCESTADYEQGSCSSNYTKSDLTVNKDVELSKDLICRVCAGSGCTPLTEKLNDCYDILSAIRSVSSVNINVDDSLPKYICLKCLECLRVSLDFKKTCQISDRKFKDILNPMGDPLLYSYPYSKSDFNLILHDMKLKRNKKEEGEERQRLKDEKKVERKNAHKDKSKDFKCSACDIVFPDKEALSSHKRARGCQRRACDVCGQLVLSVPQHRRLAHAAAAPALACRVCHKAFGTPARLNTHMLVHSNSFKFFCDQCPYRSKHKYYLVTHMRTHTGEKPYACPLCPAAFVNQSNLKKHKLTHQEKKFQVIETGHKTRQYNETAGPQCELCEKSFRTRATQREHQQAAHFNVRHTCAACGRGFCYKSDLRKHEIRSHNREKRDYVGGEPAYKQAERMEKAMKNELTGAAYALSATDAVADAAAADAVAGSAGGAAARVAQCWSVLADGSLAEFDPHGKEVLYYADVSALEPPPHALVQQQTVTLIPELVAKKNEVKVYEHAAANIAYFQCSE